MQLTKKAKDINLLVLTDIEIMTLANILNQYKTLADTANAQGTHMRKTMAVKLGKLIEENL